MGNHVLWSLEKTDENRKRRFSLVPLMEGTSTERASRRRSLRIVMRVPLYVSPADAPATAEWEPVETLVISLHGGMIRSRQQFPVGTTLDIRMRNNATIHSRQGSVDSSRGKRSRLRSRL